MVSGALETGRERPIEEVIVCVDCHLVLKLLEMKEGGSEVVE